jgi:hypothetical protein
VDVRRADDAAPLLAFHANDVRELLRRAADDLEAERSQVLPGLGPGQDLAQLGIEQGDDGWAAIISGSMPVSKIGSKSFSGS